MTFLAEYKESLDPELADAVQETAERFSEHVLVGFDYVSRKNGLLFGEVQSGKTSHTFACLAAAIDFDPSFSTVIYLVSNSNTLQEQTASRAMRQLGGIFSVCDEREYDSRFVNSPRQPRLVILKKESHALRSWIKAIENDERSRTSPLLIIDDEADAASPNTKINKDEESTTFALLDELRELGTSSIFLQVTATPQALLLQRSGSQLALDFALAFDPGRDYLGGAQLFGAEASRLTWKILEDDLDLLLDPSQTEPSPGLTQAVAHFLVVRALFLRNNRSNINANIHPSISKAAHQVLKLWVDRLIREFSAPKLEVKYEASLQAMLQNVNAGLLSEKSISVEELQVSLRTASQINVVVLNSDHVPDSASNLSEGANIVIGGNSLSRGVTFENLQTVYYTRSAKTKNADTFWQHARVFGYSRHRESLRVFMPASLISLFTVLEAAQTRLVQAINSGTWRDISVILPRGIRPTRRNVLDDKAYSYLVGGTDYFPPSPNQDNGPEVDTLLEDFEASIEPAEVDVSVLKKLLKLSSSEPDWPQHKFIGAISALSSDKHVKTYLAVRTNRNLSRGTGTMLSQDDRELSNRQDLQSSIVVIAYRVNGASTNGWDGKPFWMVNVRLPFNMVYHHTI